MHKILLMTKASDGAYNLFKGKVSELNKTMCAQMFSCLNSFKPQTVCR